MSDPGVKSNLVVRELPPDEYGLLASFPPFNETGPPHPLKARCLVVQDSTTGQVHGFLFISACVHVEPYWIDPSIRRRPGVVRRMWRAVRTILDQIQQPQAFAVITHEDVPRGILSQAQSIGFRRVPGDLYLVNVPDLPGWTEQTTVAKTVES